MSKLEPRQEKEEIVFRGKMFDVMHAEQPDGRVFETARRAPGVRLIITDRDKRQILLTKEFRRELNDWDYRLPGGKVFDSLDEYEAFYQTGEDILKPALQKVIGEGREEAGVDIHSAELVKKSTLGATVEWDLYIFECNDWDISPQGQELEAGENIETDNWFTYQEVEGMILSGEMQEERVALILLQWLKREE